jgi:hypothetical protein
MSAHYSPSKWLIQCAPPDVTEHTQRWAFAVYEILDKRMSPVDPRLIHAVYRGVVELSAEEVGDAEDAMFSARLEETIVNKWKAANRR